MGNHIQKQAFHPPNPPTKFDKEDFPYIKKIKLASGATYPIFHYPYPNSKLTCIFSQPNAYDLGKTIPFLKQFSHKFKISVVGYEYLGYGFSKSPSLSTSTCFNDTPSENGCYDSINAVYKYLTIKLKIPPEQLILMGWSIGTGPTTHLASKYPCGGVVLVAPFKNAISVFYDYYLLTPINFFRNDAKIKNISAPILIAHGKQDDIVLFNHAEVLYQLLREKNGTSQYEPIWIEDTGHNDIMEHPEFLYGIEQFFNYVKNKRIKN